MLLLFHTRRIILNSPRQMELGHDPAHVLIDANDRLARLTHSMDNDLAIVDLLQKKVVGTIATGRTPHGMRMSPPDNTVSVIDTATNRVVATITTGRGAHGVVASDDGAHVFITNIEDGTVSVIDVATQKVIDTIKVGKGPNGITLRSAPR